MDFVGLLLIASARKILKTLNVLCFGPSSFFVKLKRPQNGRNKKWFQIT